MLGDITPERAHFLDEQIRLVEEQNDGGVAEVGVVHHRVEYVQRLLQPIGGPILGNLLIVLGGGGDKDDGRNAVEALEPLLPLGPLSSHVHKQKRYLVNAHFVLHNGFGGLPCMEDINVTGDETNFCYSFQVVIEVGYTVAQLEVGPLAVGNIDGLVPPQGPQRPHVATESDGVQVGPRLQDHFHVFLVGFVAPCDAKLGSGVAEHLVQIF